VVQGGDHVRSGGSPLDPLAGLGLFGQAIVSAEQIGQALTNSARVQLNRLPVQ
jgi:hypothetical protein